MKKTLSVVLAMVMLVSTLAVFAVPTAAADNDTMWDVFIPAKEYEPTFENPKPLPGYHYTSDGFSTISPDYTNYKSKYTVASTEPQDLSGGYIFEVRIDEFAFAGENGADFWISFAIWSDSKIDQANTTGKYGHGWTNLLRGDATTVNKSENATTGDDGTKWDVYSTTGDIQPTVKDGKQYLTLEISPNWDIKVCGVEVSTPATTEYLNKQFPDKTAYISVTMNTGVVNENSSCTITKAGPNGEKPTGTASRQPEDKNREIAPIAPENTVEANKPAILFDGTLNASNKALPTGSGGVASVGEDGKSVHVVSNQTSVSLTFNVDDSISYDANDFPMIAMLVKDYCACEDPADCYCDNEGGSLWYCAGDVWSADGQHVQIINNASASYFDFVNDEEEFAAYKLAIVDLTAIPTGIEGEDGKEEMATFWEGRINALRCDFANVRQEAGRNSFDICFVGCFRNEDEIYAYVADYLGTSVSKPEDPTDPEESEELPTESEKETEANTEAGTNADTKAPETEKPTDDNEGCKSVAGVGAVAVVVAALGTGVVAFKKKRK